MLYLLLTLAILASCTDASLVRDPPKDAVMINEHTKGIKLACYFNHTKEDNEDEDDDDDDKSVISWEHEGDSAVTIKDEWVTIDERGKSILHIPDEDAKEGRITCDSGSEEHTWSVTPLFRLEPMPKSQYVSEEDDFYLKCVLDEGSMGSEEGELSFQWTRHEELDRANFTELPTNEETPHKEKHFQVGSD